MSLNKQLWTEAENLASRGYDVETFRDTLTNGEVVILARHPELPGCMAHGATLDEALTNLKEARTEYIYSLLEDGEYVPYPRAEATSTSGKQDYVAIVEDEVVGFGVAMNRMYEPETRQEDLAFSYRGDLVKEA